MSGEAVNYCQSVVNVNPVVVNHPHIIQGQPQRKGVSLAVVIHQSLKYVNNVPCVGQLCSVNLHQMSQTKSACRGQTKSVLKSLGGST